MATSEVLEGGAEAYFAGAFPPVTSAPPGLQALRVFWGARLQADLESILAVAIDHEAALGASVTPSTVVFRLGPWSVWGGELAPPEPKNGNLFEGLLDRARNEDALGVGLWELLTNTIAIGADAGGNVLFASLPDPKSAVGDVYVMSREEFGFAEPEHLAVGFKHFAHVCAVEGASEGCPAAGLAAALEPAASFVNFAHPMFRGFAAKAGISASSSRLEHASAFHFFAWRARWLFALLKASPEPKLAREAIRSILADANAPDEVKVLDASNLEDPNAPIRTLPMVAAYWLFHFYFRDRDDALEKLVPLVRESSLRLVRDVGAFVDRCRRAEPGTEFMNEARDAFRAAK